MHAAMSPCRFPRMPWMVLRRFVPLNALAWLLLIAAVSKSAIAADLPPYQGASSYRSGQNLAEYWVSEKLDGVRGHWNGEVLLFRSGNRIPAPAWFIEDFPETPLDGELWLGRGTFDALSGLLRRQETRDADWR